MFHSTIRILPVALALFVGLASAAHAASAAKEISAFNKMTVKFTQSAQKCGFESLEPFERNLRKELAAVGVDENKDSIVEVLLEVGGITYGAGDVQCAISLTLDFRTTLTAANIVSDNPAIRIAMDRLQVIPISLYRVGAFGVETTLYTVADGRNITKAEAKLIELIGHLVKRFDEERKK